jgi:iron complex transport system substrate-binding protein
MTDVRRSRTRSRYIVFLLLPLLVSHAVAQRPARIVSLIPAVGEMIFAMGAGDRLVGVSNYDRFPPEITRLPKVGGLLDPNTEQIIALRPDLVILYATQKELMQRLDRAGIPYYSYEHRALPDIMMTIRGVGARIGSAERANALADSMDRALADIRAATSTLQHPSTLLVFGRDPASLRNVYASGGYGFLHDMLEIAGGTNVFADVKTQSVQASTEMLIARHPDVIVELHYGDGAKIDAAKDAQAWSVLASVPAVRNHRILTLVGDEFVVPGPRVVDATRKLAHALHPEI